MLVTTDSWSDAADTDFAPPDRSGREQTPFPNELVLGATLMVAIAFAMTLALWFVSGNEQLPHHNKIAEPQADVIESRLPTETLLAELANEVGPSTTIAEFDAALENWLSDKRASVGAEQIALAPNSISAG